jgi:starch synthase (maltosyl-transferring)
MEKSPLQSASKAKNNTPAMVSAAGGFVLKSSIDASARTIARVVIENLTPQVDGGRFPVKRIVGEPISVEADIFVDGHQLLGAAVLYRKASESEWTTVAMLPIGNDRWRGTFHVLALEAYFYTVQAWLDPFTTWTDGLQKKADADQDITVDLLSGAELAAGAARRAAGEDKRKLMALASELEILARGDREKALELAESGKFKDLMARYPDRSQTVTYEKELEVSVDREKAGFSTWYEMFPRSCTSDSAKPGTFRDCLSRLPYIAEMGFDVLYFPPIHPIGRVGRKGKNGRLQVSAEDPGSPWAIGSTEGGHKAIHPELGTLDDFRELQKAAENLGIEIALDIAFQCAPDHPYVKQQSQWFLHRPDGSIQYAENPPKRYEDIFPFYFENPDAQGLAKELESVVLYWIAQGIRIFRVDNPHTKPFAFWESLIRNIRKLYPEVIFLSEAFTRPRIAHRLAKLGFTQSYTYFAWKTTKRELTEFVTELTQPPIVEFFRMNLWPNTPDILTAQMQDGGRPVFTTRLILAATLSANYGIYGPAYELCENRPLKRGSEEYLDSEKYQVRVWDVARTDSLKPLITRLNEIRKQNPALHSDRNLRFHVLDNDQLIAYSKVTEDRSNMILVIVNLDSRYKQSGWIEVPLERFGLGQNDTFQVHDLLADAHYQWKGSRNYVELNPIAVPAHVFKVSR